MKSEYYYYVKIIKPIEKKYNRLCILYSFFKLEIFKNKRDFYNRFLINYYKMLQDNQSFLNELEEHFNK